MKYPESCLDGIHDEQEDERIFLASKHYSYSTFTAIRKEKYCGYQKKTTHHLTAKSWMLQNLSSKKK